VKGEDRMVASKGGEPRVSRKTLAVELIWADSFLAAHGVISEVCWIFGEIPNAATDQSFF
jgi:hypothetical protein